ncbi:MAG: hypothetical protein HIU86_11365 [Acidobacteria bacterium]|nr:hypothetical protein [Acidobacteriota bacterium]
MPSALSVVRPAGVAVLLLAAVAATGLALYVSWPIGVAIGVALGAGAVLVIGARMQVSERLQPSDADLAAELGIAPAAAPRPASATSLPAVLAPLEVPTAREVPAALEAPAALEPVLHVQPDILYFTSEDDPDQVEAREVVADPVTTEIAIIDPVRSDRDQLKAELGDGYRDFARAARLVVSTQYASASRLQRDLDLPYSRARRLLADLEEQHFVGPATGSLPRRVLLSKDRLPEVEQLLADA